MAPTRTQILKYTMLPGVIPRLFSVFSSGFAHTAYIIAIIYQALRLLPPGHAYLDPRNFGRFGIRHVIFEAANNLKFRKQNIDQIVIFFTILTGMVLLLLQFALLIVAVIAEQPALAAATPLSAANILSVNSAFGHGATGGPAQDIAFIIMDRVFGLRGIFDSCIATPAPNDCLDLKGNALPATGAYPSRFQLALHALLNFYSHGVFFVAVFILLYFITVAVAETASTGTPFGQRFNKTWAPFRVMVFFALLVPLSGANGGLNSAQLITFAAAKVGSNFATNAWGAFNQTITTTYAGEANRLIAAPNVPSMSNLVKFMFVAKTCKIAEEIANYDEHRKTGVSGIQGYLVRESQNPAVSPDYRDLASTNFADALTFSNNGNLTIRFGTLEPGSAKHETQWGNVFPVCGQIIVPVTMNKAAGTPAFGAYNIQNMYYQLIQEMWETDGLMTTVAECVVRRSMTKAQKVPHCTNLPDRAFAENQINRYQEAVRNGVDPLINEQIASSDWAIGAPLMQKGWAGAAIWYNRLAQMNGEIATAIYATPVPSKYPHLMEHIAEQRRLQNSALNSAQMFNPALAEGESIKYRGEEDKFIAAPLNIAYTFWDGKTEKKSGNIFIDSINLVFGTEGIFSMRKNTDIHPLAQLSGLGKSMMEASVRNFGVGFLGGGASQLLPGYVGDLGKAASGFLQTIGITTMAMSFVLFYVLPMMPFLYFLFAVSGWIKSIFEAIVAMPLWALAHIVRMDGEGLPGPAATNGYFLILEIFLRPMLIVFGQRLLLRVRPLQGYDQAIGN